MPGIITALILMFRVVQADEPAIATVTIADPFVEMHTGAGSGYPIFHVVDRGSQISIIKQRTSWIKIQTVNGEVGWASRDQMQKTLLPSGEELTITEAGQDDFSRRRWILGASGGGFEDAPII